MQIQFQQMFLLYKKIFFAILFNATLFIFLIIGIQNSSKKSKVNFFEIESVNLPISFIVGASFICGSIAGCVTNLNFNQPQD